MTEVVAVIPCGPGRESNLTLVLEQLVSLEAPPEHIMVVLDGWDPFTVIPQIARSAQVRVRACERHRPGMEQPRNYGVKWALRYWPACTHAWFIDSDVILDPRAPTAVSSALRYGAQDAILVLPYDWLPQGLRPTGPGDEVFIAAARQVFNDGRWAMLRGTPEVYHGDLSAGLGCYSGNLIWPVDEFVRVGGFWNQLHHGRCEDGELGLRAVAMDVGIRMVPEARGYHLWHEVNMPLILERNARDVPMLDARHPWVKDQGLELVLDRDGAAFDIRCPHCEQMVSTGVMWDHIDLCGRDR